MPKEFFELRTFAQFQIWGTFEWFDVQSRVNLEYFFYLFTLVFYIFLSTGQFTFIFILLNSAPII